MKAFAALSESFHAAQVEIASEYAVTRALSALHPPRISKHWATNRYQGPLRLDALLQRRLQTQTITKHSGSNLVIGDNLDKLEPHS